MAKKHYTQFRRGDIIEVLDPRDEWRRGNWKGTIAICREVTSDQYMFDFVSRQVENQWGHEFYLDRSVLHNDVKIIGRTEE